MYHNGYPLEVKQDSKDPKRIQRNLFETICLSRYFSKQYLNVIDTVITRNMYFALPVNILLSMMANERNETHQIAMDKIVHAREISDGTEQMRHCSPSKYFQVLTLLHQNIMKLLNGFIYNLCV